VNADKFKSVEPKEELAGGIPGIYTFQPFHRITDDGAIGDSTKATKEKGKEALKRALDNVEAFITQWQ
jgi:creatinine amidohydrolase/Fe(II)-dependent formamide hydrolase-like protein